ncbi:MULTISPECIES: DUF4345 domain-containing protein [Rhizobium]|uniref:DUF4345 domain-containing protein n=1 Tax=Rhizobium rhododendri TaxID=2506430 RepID=A0ABY8IGE0_9HYPH|nr:MULTISPECIES: DUF4345 domain-containing protein [Rhizobium]MBO9100111.1 DUF4345 domain-containing protein [Rhizobium sp. L58/93]MBO9135732.1 DUF4345 domain-containing protein [Rhizobium sp. B209b/85]MBO9170077.1 DUF4345 domain-containing protein [Rhizobium sp. L245/93]MBO9186004.1 DUF4345 domain-containing protein [Rhizobium sp. E27B/91]MBZ5760859.1 DUF4345 domain-containing protein [Rhizobium sp. VS19-DR96]
MEFYFPTERGEQLAYCAAAFTALLGLFMMFAPGYAYRILGLQPREGRLGAYAEARSMGGSYIGFGLMAILLAQPMVYLALGTSFALAAFGRVLSLMSDRGNVVVNLVMLVIQVALAALPIIYFLGWI